MYTKNSLFDEYSVGMGKKGRWKNNLMKINYGVDHIQMKKDIGEATKDTSSQVAHVLAAKYALDFYSKTFGHICIKELHSRTNPKDIQLFFQEFEKVDDVLITVKDTDFPAIDEKSFVILEFPHYTRKIHARFFWAILPKDVKDPYMKNNNDHYKRLTDLLSDVHKGIEIDDY